MNAVLAELLRQLAATSPWEGLAVVLAIGYLALAIRQNIWCWPVGLASTLIYIGLMFGARLYLESALQVFYAGVSVYGWRQWAVLGQGTNPAVRVRRWTLAGHAGAIAGSLGLAAVSAALLRAWTPAALPFLDSLTTWGSIVATWMVARKFIENWFYWFVIDGIAVYVYVSRGLLLTAALFVLYLVMIVFGYRAWRRDLAGTPA